MTHTLADPTDFGNKPGDGPLRVGGRAPDIASSPMANENLPSTPSPAAAAQAPATALVRDLWPGTQSVRAAGEAYLPKHPAEETWDYASRLLRSVFFNAFRQTVVGLVGLIYRKDIELGDDVPPQIVDHWRNIDLEGKSGDVFMREVTQDAMTSGHAAILVEFPDTDGAQNRKQEQEIRPYWVPYKKEDILSWRTAIENGRVVLTQVVLRESQWVARGEFGQEAEERFRVLFRTVVTEDDVSVERVGWKLLRVTKNKQVKVDSEGFYPTQDEIPLAEITTSGGRSLFESDPPLLDVAYLNIAHYQMWSDYVTAIHKTNVPLFLGTGMTAQKDSDGNTTPLVIGPNTAIIDSNPDADAKYVSHDGAQISSTKGALDDLKSDMGTLGLAMLSPQKRSAETAEAKRLDKSQSDSALSVTARGVQDGGNRALHFHAKYLKLDSGGSMEVNRDFEGLLMDAPVMAAYAQLVTVGFPPEAVAKMLKQGGRLPDDMTIEQIIEEMEIRALAKSDMDDLEMGAE